MLRMTPVVPLFKAPPTASPGAANMQLPSAIVPKPNRPGVGGATKPSRLIPATSPLISNVRCGFAVPMPTWPLWVMVRRSRVVFQAPPPGIGFNHQPPPKLPCSVAVSRPNIQVWPAALVMP